MLTDRSAINQLSYRVIGCAIAVHRELGPGLLERPYVLAMAEELKVAGIPYRLDVAVPVVYRGKLLGCGYRMDVVVEDTIVLEMKAVREVCDVHRKQLLSYLKLTRLPLGLLMNFNVSAVRDGISRIINLPAAQGADGCEHEEGTRQPAHRASRGGG